jgi:ankyrin repeat protein
MKEYNDAAFRAAQQEDLEAVKRYIKGGGSPNMKNPLGTTMLMAAAVNGADEVVEYLLQAGADKDKISPITQISALIAAAEAGHLSTTLILVNAGAKAYSSDDNLTPEQWKKINHTLELARAMARDSKKDVLISGKKERIDPKVAISSSAITGNTNAVNPSAALNMKKPTKLNSM